MRLSCFPSLTLFLFTLILGVSAETRKFNFKIEKKDVSPDGQAHYSQAQFHSLTHHLGFERTALVINGQTPGPELHVVQGDDVEVSGSKAYIPTNSHHQI
jgi:FtsP/CotA-like multicopper oxidase with cupredoxin domain